MERFEHLPADDQRVIRLVQLLGQGAIATDDDIRRHEPAANALEIYSALIWVKELIDARMRELEPAARAVRVGQMGGLN